MDKPATPLPWRLNAGDHTRVMSDGYCLARMECGGTSGIYLTAAEAIAAWNTRPQPTASVDAEPVAWLYEHPEAKPLLRHSRFPMSVPGWTETPLYTEAQMHARADAARREALEEAAKVADGYAAAGKDNPQLAPISAQMRYCAQRIRALKENPNAG